MSDSRSSDFVFALILILCGMIAGTSLGARAVGLHPCREERLSTIGLRDSCASPEARLEERDGGTVWCRCPEMKP